MDEKKHIENIINSIINETVDELKHKLNCIKCLPFDEFREAVQSAVKWYVIEQNWAFNDEKLL